eukprot:TRINITY_DN6611_c1_g1_i1.p1 TRINITY_DN6611_c1_g1~~TRINITY_DN6611_c1_g1_i1.p1  ORF type:complete len:223 (+),score=-21.90 TRINITY_DN6611_c1_g1_i1:3-671(+)
MCHLDLKPENVLVSQVERGLHTSPQYKIGDLGLVMKASLEGYDQTEIDGGDGRYLSPELLRGNVEELRGVLCESDMWSLGCTVYALARRMAIPGGEGFAQLQQGNITVSASEYSEEFGALLKCLIEPDPVKRYSATKLLHHPLMRTPWEQKYQKTKGKKRRLELQVSEQASLISQLQQRLELEVQRGNMLESQLASSVQSQASGHRVLEKKLDELMARLSTE